MSEELIIRHCSPTLAGMKAGSLFACEYPSEKQMNSEIGAINKRLKSGGVRVLPVIRGNRALVYIYRPKALKKAFENAQAKEILKNTGYEGLESEKCVVKLMKQLRTNEEFPHEIGLFLGYPPEDVAGFMKNGAKKSKITGLWKVYGNEEAANKIFAKYKKCSEVYLKEFKKGRTLEKLTVNF